MFYYNAHLGISDALVPSPIRMHFRYLRCFSSIPTWDLFQMSQLSWLVAIPLDEKTSTSKDNIESNSPA